VDVQGKGAIPMDLLEIGDLVKTSSDYPEHSRVISFMHVDRETEMEYFQIYLNTSGVPLEISHNHLLLINNKEAALCSEEHVASVGLLSLLFALSLSG
jgi:hypothetical protein